MQQINKYNRDYLTLCDDYGKINNFQMGFFAGSGHGKGLAEEGFIEEWRKSTGGIVIVLADPKNECEFGYVNFPPIEKYHLNQLKRDGMSPKSYSVKLYHPFTFNVPKMYLPEIEFYSFSLKDLGREDWAILSESKQDSSTIKLLTRACGELGRNEGLFRFLHNIEKMSESKKKGKRIIEDPNNFYLKKPSGNAKSVSEISAMLSSFRNNYFLKRDSCDLKLDWEKILTDSENYHVFLSMFLGDLKLEEFVVLHLLSSGLKEIQRLSTKGVLKKPVLFVIPEIKKLCPVRPEGYKEFLTEAIGNAMDTVRSMGAGVSIIYDSQKWFETDERVRTGETFIGKLDTKDKELLGKALSYNKEKKEMIAELSGKDMKCCFIRFEHEGDGIFRFFLPRHMHKEEGYNWVSMFKKHGRNMKSYNELIKLMRKEYSEEDNEIKKMIEKRRKKREEEEEQKKKEKEKKAEKKEKTENKEPQKKLRPEVERKLYHLYKIEKFGSYQKIMDYWNENKLFGLEIKSKNTVGSGVKNFEEKFLESGKNFGEFEYGKQDLSSMVGEGVSEEEISE